MLKVIKVTAPNYRLELEMVNIVEKSSFSSPKLKLTPLTLIFRPWLGGLPNLIATWKLQALSTTLVNSKVEDLKG